MRTPGPLIDTFGRVHNNLRISVTDRCNLRCTYCMPEDVVFMDKHELLTFEEIAHFVEIVGAARHRQDSPDRRRTAHAPRSCRAWSPCSAKIPGINDIGLTTNGILLAQLAQPLFDAGLRRINISLDTLDPARFRQLTRRDGLEQVLDGILRRQEGGLRADQDQRRQHPRHHRARGGAAGPLCPRARPRIALHRIHADRRRPLGARQGLLRP